MATDARKLFFDLLNSDTEQEVLEVLKASGYWHDDSAWRELGDRSGNWSTIGNQQSRPEAALVEKIINSVDARLTNECLVRGIDPASNEAPESIKHAVARFFEGKEKHGDIGGSIRRWDNSRRREQAEFITLSATGPKSAPCLTLVDQGEGQSPNRIPDTFMSIDKENKLRIPFVQGKFNMGGTGALKFCGEHRFQLILTRRNPSIVEKWGEAEKDESANEWGFTIVRRELPKKGVGAVRNSVYTYLAPLKSETISGKSGVLRFSAEKLPLMPFHNKPYTRDIEWGSLVKLYNYDMKGFKSHIVFGGTSLLYRLEILMPEIALPVRLHECRDYGGKDEASFSTTLAGLTVRLEEGNTPEHEEGFPADVPFTVGGESMLARIYALKKKKGKKGAADTYRTKEGVVFMINGQTHGYFSKNLFVRKKVKMGRIADSLLVMVDCTNISHEAREDLFMNSRDRLSDGKLRKDVESQIEDVLGRHPGLRDLRERRRSQEIHDRLDDSKPLEDIIESIMKSSPTLSSLFLKGQRLNPPRKGGPGSNNGESNGGNDGGGDGPHPFKGKPHPTFFRFHKKRDGDSYHRNVELGRACRVKFDTDVENQYFSRTDVPGKYTLSVLEGDISDNDLTHNLAPHNGIATWSIQLPEEVKVGDSITIACKVYDEVDPEGFTNILNIDVIPKSSRPGGPGGTRTSRKQGTGKGGDGVQDPSGIALPDIVRVSRDEWADNEMNEHSACKIVEDAIDDGGKDKTVYTFYINVDNDCLQNELKNTKADPKLSEAKFIYGNVLVGLALIQDHSKSGSRYGDSSDGSNGEEDDAIKNAPVTTLVNTTTRALAPFMIPMIDYLGSLTDEDVTSLAATSDID